MRIGNARKSVCLLDLRDLTGTKSLNVIIYSHVFILLENVISLLRATFYKIKVMFVVILMTKGKQKGVSNKGRPYKDDTVWQAYLETKHFFICNANVTRRQCELLYGKNTKRMKNIHTG